jgi:uncharacterized protein YacL
MSFEFILRIIGLVILALAGGYWGSTITPNDSKAILTNTTILASVGAIAGLILTPYLTTRPARALRSLLGRLAAETLFAGLTGLVMGMLTAALLAFPLSMLPSPFGSILPFLGVLIFSYLGVSLFVMRQGDIMGLLSALSGRKKRFLLFLDQPQPQHPARHQCHHRRARGRHRQDRFPARDAAHPALRAKRTAIHRRLA